MNIDIACEHDIRAIAYCHREAFPSSLSSALGMCFLIRSFQWYLANQDAFLLVAKDVNGLIMGYAGGLFVHKKSTHGSSTSMIQYAFKEAVIGMLIKPWLLFHPELFRNYRLILKNVRLKIFPQKKSNRSSVNCQKRIQSLGLVVIGTSNTERGKGVGSALLQAFENQGRILKAEHLHLSVRKNNLKAIKAYNKNGWMYMKETEEEIRMIKTL